MQNTKQSQKILIAIILMIGFVLLGYFLGNNNKTNTVSKIEPIIRLNSLEYEYNQKGELIKRKDDSIDELGKLLISMTEDKSCKSVLTISVLSNSKDYDSAKLSFNCDGKIDYFFTKKEDGKWKDITGTSNFSPDGIISCGFTKQYKLDKEVAPLCFENKDNDVQYKVR
jgi:hypothetical protein